MSFIKINFTLKGKSNFIFLNSTQLSEERKKALEDKVKELKHTRQKRKLMVNMKCFRLHF
jgi:hypothetical protein